MSSYAIITITLNIN